MLNYQIDDFYMKKNNGLVRNELEEDRGGRNEYIIEKSHERMPGAREIAWK